MVERLRPYMGIKSFNVWDGKPMTEAAEIAAEVDLPDPNTTEE